MMNKKIVAFALSLTVFPVLSHAEKSDFKIKEDQGFKRFSISAGWLHASPQGSANALHASTAVQNGDYQVGDVSLDAVTGAIAPTEAGDAAKKKLLGVAKLGETLGLIKNGVLTADMSGKANINSLESWDNPNTGLEAQDVDTLGIMASYYFTDHWSVQFKGGIPPTVNIKGKGQVNAPLSGVATPKGEIDTPLIGGVANALIDGIGDIPLDTQIPITNLSQGSNAASARAWLPAAEIQYQFGKTGVNKFRPYVGAGVIYAYFDKVKLNTGIETDLISAGHKVQNILDNRAGAALDGKTSSADPRIKVEATDAIAPIVTVGATYDFNQNWFAVGSISYAKMNNDAKITVTDNNTGKQLISSKTQIDIDPIISYVGVGYRF